jgi:lipopolysaccharide transport system ATP-binding protein
MYVRLAFAVAAHLEAQILLVDEVLAVGDTEFQKKCLAKMHDVSRAGRTVVFISHSMAAISLLCPRALWVHQGNVIADGPSDKVVAKYSANPDGPPQDGNSASLNGAQEKALVV